MLYQGKDKKNKYYIDIKHNGNRILRSTTTSDKTVAQLIHDDFMKELAETGNIPDIKPIILRHIYKDYQKNAVFSEKVASVVDLSWRLEKSRIRKKLLAFATENIKGDITALTLPGTEWVFERDLLLTNRCNRVVGLEGSRDVYIYSTCSAPEDKRITFLNMTDKTYAESRKYKEKFNFIWLDYMGNFSESSITVFEKFLDTERIADDCIIALTFKAGREHAVDQLYGDYLHLNNDNTHNEARKAAIPQYYADIARGYGYSSNILASEIYREEIEDKKTGNMLLVVLKLSKSAKDGHFQESREMKKIINKCYSRLVKAEQNEWEAIRANFELGALIAEIMKTTNYGKRIINTIADDLSRKIGKRVYEQRLYEARNVYLRLRTLKSIRGFVSQTSGDLTWAWLVRNIGKYSEAKQTKSDDPKSLTIKMIKEGADTADISSATGYSIDQVRAFKAHFKMGHKLNSLQA